MLEEKVKMRKKVQREKTYTGLSDRSALATYRQKVLANP
jgi:hypothetical protein